MKTIDNKTKGIEKWKQAEKDLEEFNKIIEIIKQYLVKILKIPPPCKPYEPSEF